MNRADSNPSRKSSIVIDANGYLGKEHDDYAEPLVDAPITFLPKSQEVVIHLALLGIWAREAEHQVGFSLDHQTTISFAITAITTGFGTIYLGLVVFVAQTISVRRLLQADQTLTAIHDSTAAWAGIGSAVCHLWHQTRVRGSLWGVLSIFLSLGSVLVLHVSTTAFFAVQAFSSSRLLAVPTNSLPGYNDAQWGDEAWPYVAVKRGQQCGNKLLDSWATWYLSMPPSSFPFLPFDHTGDTLGSLYSSYVSVGAMYLIQKLQMHVGIYNGTLESLRGPAVNSSDLLKPLNVTLHDLENALGILVASMFWTLTHFSPTLNGLKATVPPPVTLKG
ncbi:hypothetical protein DFH06DRAFT_1336957 [Mycena polygramma]|nr:hypothetical protein DFH06DRAFT_1336957 [Mycena polygramma]